MTTLFAEMSAREALKRSSLKISKSQKLSAAIEFNKEATVNFDTQSAAHLSPRFVRWLRREKKHHPTPNPSAGTRNSARRRAAAL